MFEFLSGNALYVVMIISLVVWAGIYIYLVRLQKQVEELEKQKDAHG